MPSAETIPVLKMPVDQALPALRLLTSHRKEDDRRKALIALRPGLNPRTQINAYVLPSLTELGLFEGTLRDGEVTRYGKSIAEANLVKANGLMARRLLELDSARVGFVDWLTGRGEPKQTALRRFVESRLKTPEELVPQALDRLGKWLGYLLFFDVIRENRTTRGVSWSVNRRQLAALDKLDLRGLPDRLPPESEQVAAILEAYGRVSQQLGTRLYLPITAVRDELGRVLADSTAGTFTDGELDEILARTPALLSNYIVTFSPFSGPAQGGLEVGGMYAGFVSIRRRPSTDDEPSG